MLDKIKQTATFIKESVQTCPEIGIILGSGLGNLSETIENPVFMPYNEIPNFPVSTVKGHKGRMIFGTLSNTPVIAMQGRFHFYEGYTMKELTFPIRVMKELGIKLLILSNAAGGVNLSFKVGDIMIITDHINLMPSNPLIGHNIDELGTRFPDMSEPYNLNYVKKINSIAKRHNITVQNGVYAAVTGPCYETPSEYRYVKAIGADAVGMSTVPEVIAARHAGLDCLAISVITDMGGGAVAEKVSHEDVIVAANKSEPLLTLLIKEFISEYKQ
jgi:purine-nucleoside phosphorylase